MGFRDLLAFLTTLPVGAGSLEGAARWYWASPVVGAVVGVLSALAAFLALESGLGVGVAGALYLAAHLVLTGGLHYDGVADVGDMLHSGARGEEARKIMADPRKGAGGIMLLVALMILQYSAAAELLAHGREGLVALALGHVYSYQAMYLASTVYPASPYMGLGRTFKELGTRPWMVAASLTTTIVITALPVQAGAGSPLCEAAAGIIGGVMAARVPVRRLGYANGDVLGYAQEIARTIGLLGALACL